MSARIVHPDDPKYLKAAFSVLGLSEIAGERDEPQILAMYKACGHGEIADDEVPWCAAYVGWCLHKGGLKNTGSLLAISYANYPGAQFGKDDTVPRGAICVWPRTGGNHVNFALADLGDFILTIGGNQGNGRGGGVTIAKYPKRMLKVAVMPGGVRVPPAKPKAEPKSTPMPPVEAPAPEKPAKTGVSEGAKLGAGIGIAGILSQVWEALAQAPEHLIDVLMRAAQKPPFWLFVAVAGLGAAIWWRRSLMKKEA
jgi:uncharacterized protein (TIGR02594 family)